MKCYYYYNSSLSQQRKDGKFIKYPLNGRIIPDPVIKRSSPVIVNTEQELDKFFLRVITLRLRDRFARAMFDFPRYLDALRRGGECH